MTDSNGPGAGLLMAGGMIVVVIGFIIGLVIALDATAFAPSLLTVPLGFIGVGGAMVFAGDRLAKMSDDSGSGAMRSMVPFFWIACALIYAVTGFTALGRLASPVSWRDPETWCLAVYGFAGLVLVAYVLRVTLRFRRAGAAATSAESRVVIARDRLASAMLLLGLLLLEPEFVISAWTQPKWQPWAQVFAAGAFAFLTLQKVREPAEPTVIDENGIECPGQWLGRIRWQDLDDIRLESAIAPGRFRARVPCLGFVFRDGVPVPRRTYPQRHLDVHLALGCFMVMPAPLGLPITAGLDGLKMRLERYRAAQPPSVMPEP